MKKRLLHLSLERVDRFKQRVPLSKRREEDNTLNRICLSDTIENCLSSVIWFGSGSSSENIMSEVGSKIIFVHEFLIDENLLKKPNEVFGSGNVLDAIENQEYWYIGEKDLIPDKIYAITISDYDEEEINVLSPKLQELYNEDEDIDLDDYYDLENDLYYANIYKPYNLKYKVVEKVITGDSFCISYNNELTDNYEHIIKSVFEKMLSFMDIRENSNIPNIDTICREDKLIEISTTDIISYDYYELLNQMNELGLNVESIATID